jgi:MYXO-CTERM domain-containing protein
MTAFVTVGMTGIGLAQNNNYQSNSRPKPIKHAPEIDSASATAALALLAGGVLVVRARRR